MYPPAAGLPAAGALGDEYEGGVAPGQLGGINPTGCQTNCVNTSIATAKTIAGQPTIAEPSGSMALDPIEGEFGGYFQGVSGQAEIEKILQQAGDGAQGILAGRMPGGFGHVWNAANFGGDVEFIDGQCLGTGLSNFDTYWGNLMFLLIP